MKKANQIHPQRSVVKVLSLLVIISSLIGGCQLPWRASQEATPQVSEISSDSTATPQPRKDLPPALVEVSPIPNSIISLQQPISLSFNQPMDIASVESAISFDPQVSGRFSWDDDQVLTFTPDEILPPGALLNMEVAAQAQAANGKALQDPINIHFQMTEELAALQVVPSDRSLDVDPESVVFVTFNQPVVSLGADDDAEPGFTLSPDVSGTGAWLNTSTYAFTPDPSMNGGTLYTIALNEELLSVYGAGLTSTQSLNYRFTTTKPQVMNILPLSSRKLRLDGPVEIDFNIRMDTESVEFLLMIQY